MKKTKRILSKMLALMLTVMLSVGMFSSLGFSVDEKAPVGPHDAGVSSRQSYGEWPVPECSGTCLWSAYENGGYQLVSLHITTPSVGTFQSWPAWLKWGLTQEDSYKHRHCTKAYSDVHGGPFCVAAHDPVPCPKCGKCTQCTGPDDCKCNTCPLCNKKYDQCTCKPPESTIKFSPLPGRKTYTAPDGKVYYSGEVQLDIVNANATGMTLRQVGMGEGTGLYGVISGYFTATSSVQSDRQLTQMYRAYYNGKYELTISNDNPNHTTTVQTFLVTGIDGYDPEVSLVSNPTNWTNQDKQITVKGWDKEDLTSSAGSKSGIKEFQLVNRDTNATISTTPTTENAEKVISVPTNGVYYIDAVDNVGNIGSIGVPVTHIDKIKPVVSDIQVNLLPSPINRAANTVGNKQAEITLSATDAETMTGGFSNCSGVNKIEYQLVSGNNSVQTNGWITYNPNAKPKITDEFVGSVYARTIDNAGNQSETKSTTVMLEGTAPTINVTSSNISPTNQNVTLNVACADGGRVVSGVKEITLPDSSVVNTTTSQYTATQNGSYLFKVKDNAGNESSTTFTVDNIDKTIPTVNKIQYEAVGETATTNAITTNKNVTLTLEASDTGVSGLNNIQYQLVTKGNSVNESGWINYNANSKPVISNEFTGDVCVRAVDRAGNISSVSRKGLILVKTAPTISCTVSTGAFTTDDIVITLKGNVKFGANGAEIVSIASPFTDTPTVPSKTADNSISVNYTATKNDSYVFTVTDKVGNVSECRVNVANIDRTAPLVNHQLSTTEWTKNDVVINIAARDDLSNIASIQTPTGSYTSDTCSYTVSKDGDYDFIVTDGVGNKTTHTVIVRNIIDKTVPTLNSRISNEGYTNENVDITFGVQDLQSGLASITGPDGKTVSIQDTEKNLQKEFTYSVDENKAYSFTVTDKVGNTDTKTLTLSKIDKIKPTMKHTLNESNWTNQDITINVVGEDNLSGIKTITMPNSEIKTSSDVNYVVAANGDYSFVANDVAGNSQEHIVTVGNIDKEKPELNSIKYKKLGGSLMKSIKALFENSTENYNRQTEITLKASDKGGSNVKTIEYQLVEDGKDVDDTKWQKYDENNKPIVTKQFIGTVFARAVDTAGNISDSKTLNLILEDEPPVVTTKVDTKDWTNGNVTITVNCEDKISGVKEILDATGNIVDKTKNEFTFVADKCGDYTFTVTDNANNVTSKTVEIKNIDKQKPIANHNVDNSYTTGYVVVEMSVGDEPTTEYSASGILNTVCPDKTVKTGRNFNYSVNKNGNYDFIVTDKAGNKTTHTVKVTTVDTASPTLSHKVNTKAWTNEDVTITVDLEDMQSGLKEITTPDGNIVTAFESRTNGTINYVVSQNGNYEFVAKDNVDNETKYIVTVNNIDKTSSDIKTSVNTDKWTNKDVVITVNCEDKESGIKEIFDAVGNKVEKGKKEFTFNASECGDYTFTVKDNADNVTRKTVEIRNVDKTEPIASSKVDDSYTSGNVIIEMTVADKGDFEGMESGILNTVCPDNSKKTDGNFKYAVTKNGSYDFVVTDKAGNEITHTVKVTTMDTTSPTLTHKLNTTDWTGEDVTITVDLEDTQSALKEIKTPDGKTTKFNKANQKIGSINYVVSKNGDYEFIAKDNVDNETKYTVTVNNIDKFSSKVTGSLESTEWTKHDANIVLEIEDKDSGEGKVLAPDEKYYSITTGKEITEETPVKSPMSAKGLARANSLKPIKTGENTEKPTIQKFNFKVDANGSYSFIVYDNVGNETPITVDVSNIDKVKPTIDVTNDNEDKPCRETALQVVTADNASGIQSVVLPNGKTTGEKNPTYSVDKNGKYTFYVVDNAGNDKACEIEVKNIDEEVPTTPTVIRASAKGNFKNGRFILDWNNGPVSLNFESEANSGISKYLYKIGNGDWQETEKGNLTIKSEGKQAVTVKSQSNAGNTSEELVIEVKTDFTKPTAEFKETKTGLSVEADDKLSGIKSIECDCGKTEGGHKTCALSAGNHNHKYTITDNAGNVLVTEKEITINGATNGNNDNNGNGNDKQNLTNIGDEKTPLSLGKKMAIAFSAFALIVLLILLIMYVVYKTYKKKKAQTK